MLSLLVDLVFGVRCPYCRDRSRDLPTHIDVDHADEQPRGWWHL